MDARVGDRVVTPRIGKPVEVEALWLNALRIAASIDREWTYQLARARAAFRERFWNAERGCLFDVVDVEHACGTADPTIRPNQILAVGGLPFQALEGERARLVVECVERELVTPAGLRSLARQEPGYTPRYEGDPSSRDGAYHQGTVWPWLMGPFIEAWLRVRGGGADVRQEARRRFLDPMVATLDRANTGHIPEIADAEAPHVPRGCPFQAWSLGEVMRIEELLRAERARRPPTLTAAAR
jgi:glycogen debranching enzyme